MNLHGLAAIESFWHDVRYAGRLLRRSPAFCLFAMLSLSLSIGANTLVFSIVNSLVLKRPPVDAPETLVFVQSRGQGTTQSYPNYRDLRAKNQTLSGLIGYRLAPLNLDSGDRVDRVWGYLATDNYFDVLGTRPALGQFFQEERQERPGSTPYAVLSYDCWQGRFLADPGIVGRTVRINRQSFTVVGVAAPGFYGTELFYRPEIWVPMMMQPQLESGNPWLDQRATFNMWVLGRLKPGTTVAQAEADLNGIAGELAQTYPWPNKGMAFRLTRPGLVGDTLREPVKMFTLSLFALAALVLLAGCANLAGLLLARGTDRQREMALRMSIGAGPRRLSRQLLTEALLLSLTSAVLGAAIAALGSAWLSAWQAPVDLPLQFDVRAEPRVFAFAVAISSLAGILFGIAPARQAWRLNPSAALKGDGRAGGRRANRWVMSDVLVAVQVALCFVLVVACLVSIKALQQASAVPLGFEPRGVMVLALELGPEGYDQQRGELAQQQLLQSVLRIVGVQASAYSNSIPLSIDQSFTTVTREGARDQSEQVRGISYYRVSPGFLQTMGMRLLAGRDFELTDDRQHPRVAIVNQTFLRRVLQLQEPSVAVGRRFHSVGQLWQIIGVMEDVKVVSLSEPPQPAMLLPTLQSYSSTTLLLARSALPPSQVVREMRQAVSALDPHLATHGAGTAERMLGLVLLPNRAAVVALTALGVLALALAITGLYGVVAYAVSQRQKEIGIRLALGAHRSDILRQVLGRMVLTLACGSAAGLVLAYVGGRLLGNMVPIPVSEDPLVAIGVVLVMLVVGTTASYVPTRRALRIDPSRALRGD